MASNEKRHNADDLDKLRRGEVREVVELLNGYEDETGRVPAQKPKVYKGPLKIKGKA